MDIAAVINDVRSELQARRGGRHASVCARRLSPAGPPRPASRARPHRPNLAVLFDPLGSTHDLTWFQCLAGRGHPFPAWRWGRKGSLSVVVGGAKAGMWFDHVAGDGGGFVDLVGRDLGLSRDDALDWTADHIGMGRCHRPIRVHPAPPILSSSAPVSPQAQPGAEASPQTPHDDVVPAYSSGEGRLFALKISA